MQIRIPASLVIRGIVLVRLLLPSASAWAQPIVAAQSPRPVVTATGLIAEERIVLDGVFDEPVWSRTVPATDFTQQDPRNGTPSTERTEVRFAFSRDALYMAVTCFDSEPDRLLGNTMKRDEFLRADDRFMWVIDPFLNAQGGYFFEMNPSGLMGDSLMSASGPVNREWDGIWDSQVRRSEIGWTIEISIPFRTLNFDPNGEAWGVNFQRTIRRKNEETLWTGWAYNQGLFRIQNTGLLLGISEVAQGHGLDLRPYAVASSSESPGRPDAPGDATKAKFGLDAYYSITPAIRTNLTINTDFAQTEVDQRQVNLTRYSLFFPEKRIFFLEGASYFDFISSSTGRLGSGSRGAADTAVVPFFSRRIGLNAGGLPQKVDVGGKLTGQVGRQDVGFLQMRTGDDNGAPGEDFTVMRVKRRMLKQSYVGALYTRRAGGFENVEARHTAGADYRFATTTFRGNQNLEATGYVIRTTNAAAAIERSGKNYAYGFAVDYPNDRYIAGLSYREVQDNYDPAVGFTLRNGYRRYRPEFRVQPRPRRGSLVRQYAFGIDGDLQSTTKNNELLLREWNATVFRALLQTQDSMEVHVLTTEERLDANFTISPGITLPAGSQYEYTRARFQATTAANRIVAVTSSLETGQFYSGDRTQVIVNLSVRPRTGIVWYLDAELNKVNLAEGRFTARLFRSILDTQFSPWIALTNNVQYDSLSRVLGLQSRLRWILKPGSDLYVVYNHNWIDDPLLRKFTTLDRSAASKVLYTFGF